MKVLVLPGSARRDSLNRRLARVAAGALERAGIGVDLAEFREFAVPLYDGDVEAADGVPPGAAALRDRLHAAGALCLVTPEYNHSVPGTVKNLVDWVSRLKPNPLKGVPAVVMSASPGLAGGSRGAWAVKVPLELLGMYVFPAIFSLAQAHQAFAADGSLADPALAVRLDGIAREFAVFARAVSPAVPRRPDVAG